MVDNRMENQPPDTIDGPHGQIAYHRRDGGGPGIVWLGGFRSDMLGTKAGFLDRWAQRRSRAFLRFDYSGHGESSGRFEDGCIGEWAADALTSFDALTDGAQILVGSSMGAWIAALLALQRPERIAGIVFIAPAPDFTEKLMRPNFTEEQRETIEREGRLELPGDYDEPEIITKKLLDDGRRHLVMTGPIAIACPVRILQGMQDASVPWRHAVEFAELISSDRIEITLTKAGDHRLSTPADLDRLAGALEQI